MRLGKIPVEFVPAGMTPEEARRLRKKEFGPSKDDIKGLIGLVSLLLLLCGGAGWWYLSPDQSDAVARLEPAQLTATARAGAGSLPEPVRVTPLPPPERLAAVRWFPSPPPDVSTPAPVWRSYQSAALVMFTPTPPVSPLPTPAPPLVIVGSVDPTPAPTATVNPYDYVVIGHQIESSPLYSYISGWVLENDGLTPRPVRVRLRYPDGVLEYPRPRNSDIANGRYEFLVSPGEYWLEIEDGSTPRISVNIGAEYQRHEVSFKLAVDRPPASQPAQSRPWGRGPTPTPRPQTTPATIPTPIIYHEYLPDIFNSPLPQSRNYLPVVVKK